MSHSNKIKIALPQYDLREKLALSIISFTFEYLYSGFSLDCMNLLPFIFEYYTGNGKTSILYVFSNILGQGKE